jgi:multicomponent Na+:H+ antiporter subunit D
MENIADIRLLLAVLAPLLGAGLVMANGKRPNLRETISFIAAATLFITVASMVPAVSKESDFIIPCSSSSLA